MLEQTMFKESWFSSNLYDKQMQLHGLTWVSFLLPSQDSSSGQKLYPAPSPPKKQPTTKLKRLFLTVKFISVTIWGLESYFKFCNASTALLGSKSAVVSVTF